MRKGYARRDSLIAAIFEAIPSPAFIVDKDVRIVDFNGAAAAVLPAGGKAALGKRGGDALHCIRAMETAGGCGAAPACRDCAIRNAVTSAVSGGKSQRVKSAMSLRSNGSVKEIDLLVTASPFGHGGTSYVFLLLEDVSELVRLRRLLPVCAWCRKIRTEKNYWECLEEYFKSQFGVNVTHSICEDCASKVIRGDQAEARSLPPR
ncbi:MAG: hypothetical protein A2X91_02450 [Deltaproteobacteria bacterium GWB2_65_81]|nr:MAG: hypothetical protein A2X90_07210 [Deltaproteobacteria bacterium GWA2_65_63]OGP27521.1 MAG: hypothetical protein A2X91_02450 [Deltaproteobacteria bacterium GWB2_65_81]OGP40543.1 MAG: hypothetical protein A2X98_00190 [Deltaproteobacteria bacterium GWC2_66_88]HAM33517.1 hypothetical protein [Deltaproteobacteria bacterium]